MKYLFEDWNEVIRSLAAKNIMLFLDYDGTISPIVERPEDAVIRPGIRPILEQIIHESGIRVAVISGRSLKDIRERVNIQEITYSGNHGLEINGPGFEYQYEIPGIYSRELDRIREELSRELSGFRGVIIEDKDLTLSVHYRQLDKEHIPDLHAILARYYSNSNLKVREEKMTFEIVPQISWNKGNAILKIMEHAGNEVFPVFLGDTITDEDAFLALKNIGLCIRVGFFKHSAAHYYLNNVPDVEDFLQRLLSDVLDPASKNVRA